MKVYVLFETDPWLTKANATILAICTSREEAVNLFVKEVEKSDLSPSDKEHLISQMKEMSQTQSGSWNYYIEEYDCNKMLLEI